MGESPQQLVVFVVGRQRFAVSLSHVLQVVAAVQWTPLPDAPEIVLGIIDFHGEIIPVVDLRLGLRPSGSDVSVADQFLVVTTEARTVAIVVNDTQGVIARNIVPLVSVGLGTSSARKIAGAITLDDGLVLIHDMERFFSAEELHRLDEALKEHMLEGFR